MLSVWLCYPRPLPAGRKKEGSQYSPQADWGHCIVRIVDLSIINNRFVFGLEIKLHQYGD